MQVGIQILLWITRRRWGQMQAGTHVPSVQPHRSFTPPRLGQSLSHWLLQRAPWMQTTRLFSVAFYKPSPLCFSCGCLVFLKRVLRWLHIHHQPPQSLWAQLRLSHRGLEGSGPSNLLQAQWLTEICLMVLPKLWDDILQTWWAFVSLNPENIYKMGVWISVFFFLGEDSFSVALLYGCCPPLAVLTILCD